MNVPEIFRGQRVDDCNVRVWADGELLSPNYSLVFRCHSPGGFNWGYRGAGPMQLALAIMLEITHPVVALEMYQWFQYIFVEKMPKESWLISSVVFLAWIETEIEVHDLGDLLPLHKGFRKDHRVLDNPN
jgi:hypothetical protein